MKSHNYNLPSKVDMLGLPQTTCLPCESMATGYLRHVKPDGYYFSFEFLIDGVKYDNYLIRFGEQPKAIYDTPQAAVVAYYRIKEPLKRNYGSRFKFSWGGVYHACCGRQFIDTVVFPNGIEIHMAYETVYIPQSLLPRQPTWGSDHIITEIDTHSDGRGCNLTVAHK